ncbi:hypothetical protein BaRGS_00008517 [Batillaria attramentaria]|uniref:Zinc finger CCCH domain-containing protein 3 n=1 Tax=Batillaria attramentaria TaxID=370345 RepID=A0ABD0LL93_9CAEN
MADVSETQTLLRQIKFLTDLINDAKQKEEKAQHCHYKKSPSASPSSQVSAPSFRQPSAQHKSQNISTCSVSKASSLSYPPSHAAKSHIDSNDRTSLESGQLLARGPLQRHCISYPSVQQSAYSKSEKGLSTSTSNRKVQYTTGNTTANRKPTSVQLQIQQGKHEETKNKMDQLSHKKAEVSVAREAMKSKIEDLKASIAQLSEAKTKRQKSTKEQSSGERCASARLLNEQRSVVVKPGQSRQTNVDNKEKQETREGKLGSKQIKHSSNVSVSAPGKANEPLRKTETLPLAVSSCSSRSVIMRKQLSQSQTAKGEGIGDGNKNCPNTSTAAAACQSSHPQLSQLSNKDSGSETRQTVFAKDKMVTNDIPSKSSAVADLQRELLATERKLHSMRQKIGCMLKESPTKATPSRSASNTELLPTNTVPSSSASYTKITARKGQLAKDAHFSQENIPQSPSTRNRPFPNRRSLKWTPQKHHVDSSGGVLVVGSSPSLRSFRGKPHKTAVIRADSSTNTTFLSQASCSNESHSRLTKLHGDTKVISSAQVGSGKKVQTTRCVFGKYSLRNVKTGSSPSTKTSLATGSIKTRFKVVKNPAQTSRNVEARSVVQRAAKVVISKYKMQRVSVPAVTSKAHSPYQKPKSAYAGGSFSAKAYPDFNQYGWRQGQSGRGRYRGGYTKRQFHGSHSGWWKDYSQYSSTTAFLKKKKAMALKMKMSWPQMQWSYSYNRHSITQSHRVSRQEQLQRRLKLIRKYKLLKWRSTSSQQSASPTKSGRERQDRLLMINGILYRSSSTSLTKASKFVPRVTTPQHSAFPSTVVVKNVNRKKMQTVTVRGVRFRVDGQGTKLQRVGCASTRHDKTTISRVDIGGTTYIQTKEGTLEKVFDNQTKSVINRVKQRSIARVAAKFKKDNTRNKKKFCLFYSRFGKCSRGQKCPYTHDPDKIAVCTRFLRGTCKVEQCPFSHKVAKEKMPVCAFFLRGVCAREDCPYLHVKVSQGAEVCQDFVNGFCSLADKCQKLHTLTCPSFSKTGSCPDGKKCRLQHRHENVPKTKNSKPASSESTTQTSRLAVKRRLSAETRESDREADPGGDSELPRKLACLPAFISLADYSTDESPAQTPSRSVKGKPTPSHTGSSLQIKPRI